MQNGSGPRKHTIAVLVENKFGVLSRVAGLFSARGYNIESLSVGETLDPSVSRMTIVVTGDEFVIEQVTKQLHKLIDVIKVSDLTDDDHVERELMLIRVNAEPQHREEILRTADIFRAKVVDVTPVSFTLEATGDEPKLEARSEEHTSELQSQSNLVCRLLLEKKKNYHTPNGASRRRHL